MAHFKRTTGFESRFEMNTTIIRGVDGIERMRQAVCSTAFFTISPPGMAKWVQARRSVSAKLQTTNLEVVSLAIRWTV